MLTRYKDESSTRQGKGEDGTTRPKAKEAASRAGTGRRNRKEDGYVQVRGMSLHTHTHTHTHAHALQRGRYALHGNWVQQGMSVHEGCP